MAWLTWSALVSAAFVVLFVWAVCVAADRADRQREDYHRSRGHDDEG